MHFSGKTGLALVRNLHFNVHVIMRRCDKKFVWTYNHAKRHDELLGVFVFFFDGVDGKFTNQIYKLLPRFY